MQNTNLHAKKIRTLLIHEVVEPASKSNLQKIYLEGSYQFLSVLIRLVRIYSCVKKVRILIHKLSFSVQRKVIETQQAEVCLSTYRDTDSTGQGTLKPDSIPDMKEAISELDTFRMDPNRYK